MQTSGSMSSSFADLDKYIHGLDKSDLILLAGRPGMGTTSFALNIAVGAAKIHSDKAIVIISLESTKAQIASRILAAESSANIDKLDNDEDYETVIAAAERLSKLQIYVDESLKSVSDMQSDLCEIENLGLVIVDYVELIAGFDFDCVRISEMLREMACSLGVPVIAVAKLPHSVETREDKRPLISDVYKLDPESVFYDVVLCLYRESYYNRQLKQPYLAECIVAKNRQSEIGTIYLHWNAEHTKFSSLSAEF